MLLHNKVLLVQSISLSSQFSQFGCELGVGVYELATLTLGAWWSGAWVRHCWVGT